MHTMVSMKRVTITTDGACDPNPGPGGWAAILRCGNKAREIFGRDPRTTNNRMEMQAIIEGLRALKEPCEVLIRTDSKIAMDWCHGLQFAKQKPRLEKPEAYALHLTYAELAKKHVVRFEWVKGHSGDPDNERADLLAESASRAATPDAPASKPVPLASPAKLAVPVISLPATSATKIRLTRENLHQLSGSPSQDGFTKRQIELLGFSWPPPKGWLSSLIGTEIERELYERIKLAISARRLQARLQSQIAL